MGFMSLVYIFRDFIVDGVPSSGRNKPKKSDIRNWGAWVESLLNAVGANSGTIFTLRSALFSDLTKPANTMAWVVGDPNAAFNGIYMKVGAANTGSWSRVGDLPYSFIQAQNAGAGTANAIQATTTLPISGTALVVLPIAVDNTSSPVTVSFNGDTALTIKSNSGNDIVAGGLLSGMMVFGVVVGSTFRILNDQVSAAIVAAAEAAAADALAYRDAALAAVPNAFPTTLAAFKALPTSTIKNAYFNGGFWKFSTGSYAAALAIDTAGTAFVKADDTASTSGAWVRVLTDGVITPEMAGAVGNGVADDSAAFNIALAVLGFVGGGTLRARASYKLKNVNIPSNVTVDARGAKITAIGGGAGNMVWRMVGTRSGVRRAISNVSKGSILVTCTTPAQAADFAVGDYVIIQNEVFASPGSFGKNQEIARVAQSNPATGEVSLENTLVTSFGYIGSTPTIEKITPIVNSQIIGGSSYLSYNSNAEGGHIALVLCVRCKVKETTIEGVNNIPGITVRESTDIDVVENRVRVGHNMAAGGYGYAISIEEASHGIRVHRNQVSKCREVICTDRCRFVIFSENQIFGNYLNGINSHSSQNEAISIIDNQIHGITAGVGISFGQGSGSNNDSVGVIKGNIIRNTFADGIQVAATSSITSQVIVDGNMISGFGQNLADASGIYITAGENVQVTNNQINGGGAQGNPYGIFISGLNKAVVAHNMIESVTFGISMTSCAKMQCQGNKIEGASSQCIRVPTTDNVAVWILDNFSNVSNQSINATGTYQHRNSWNTLP